MEIINRHRKELERACARYRVKALYVFGSVLSERFHPESDIDFLVAIDSNDPLEYAELYFALKFELERIFQRKIDLLELKALRNQRFKSIIDKEKILVYGRHDKSLA
ncbi:MAG: nucleotidyltransferase domain-containing protein [Bacteroidetes bacterium]|nr:MAG: nucleotidyltransferase domain-containing protein [Bacteroidota bacterium]